MTIKVDLLPTERKKFGFDPVIGFLLLIIIIFVIGFVVYGTSLEKKIELKKQEIAEVDYKIKELEKKLPVIESLRSKNRELEQQINTIKSLVYDPIRYANLLDEVSLVLPRNIWVSTISIEPATSSVTFNGTSVAMQNQQPLESIGRLMKNLQKSRYFYDATLSSTSQTRVADAYMGYTFQIETHYNPEKAAKLSEMPVQRVPEPPMGKPILAPKGMTIPSPAGTESEGEKKAAPGEKATPVPGEKPVMPGEVRTPTPEGAVQPPAEMPKTAPDKGKKGSDKP
jgi:Tfp pilus assembly protein PilN